MGGRWKGVFFLVPVFLLASSSFALEFGEAKFTNSIGLFSNDDGPTYRLSYFGYGKYKNAFTKIVYRADHTGGFHDKPFTIFKPGLGYRVYGPFSLRYQYERKEIRGKKKIVKKEQRLGVSVGLKRALFGGKLKWSDDLIVYLYEKESDQQIRWIANLHYWRLRATNILLFDIDHSGDRDKTEFEFFNLLEVACKVYGPASVRFQWQAQEDHEDVYRLGLGVNF